MAQTVCDVTWSSSATRIRIGRTPVEGRITATAGRVIQNWGVDPFRASADHKVGSSVPSTQTEYPRRW